MKGNRLRFFAIFLGALGVVVCVYQLNALWNQPATNTWTPQHLALRLDSVSDRFEVYVKDTNLAQALANGKIVPKDSIVPLSPGDVTVRVNNFEHQRVERIKVLVALGAGVGAAAMLLLLGLAAPSSLGMGSSGITEVHLLHEA